MSHHNPLSPTINVTELTLECFRQARSAGQGEPTIETKGNSMKGRRDAGYRMRVCALDLHRDGDSLKGKSEFRKCRVTPKVPKRIQL